MLSASAYSLRQKSRLAISLSWVAGYTNVITLMFCNTTTSHMTGNVTHLGQAASELSLRSIIFFGHLILAFVTGAALAGVLLEVAKAMNMRSRYALPMAIEAILLTGFSLGLNVHLMHAPGTAMSKWKLFWMTGVATTAMGLQNATITRISGAVVRTTHLTGVSTDFGLECAQLLFTVWKRFRYRWLQLPTRAQRMFAVSRRNPSVQRLAVLAGIFWSFFFGGMVGALAVHYALWLGVMPPVVFLTFMIIREYLLPMAELEQLDLHGDAELRALGIDRSLLPPQLGLYRLSYPKGRLYRERYKAPHFLNWVERLPAHWRVIILSIGPQTPFESNAFLDLQAAVEVLRKQHRRLILSGITPAHYHTLHALKVTDVLDMEDLCPDLEFAVARGIELVRVLT